MVRTGLRGRVVVARVDATQLSGHGDGCVNLRAGHSGDTLQREYDCQELQNDKSYSHARKARPRQLPKYLQQFPHGQSFDRRKRGVNKKSASRQADGAG